MYSFRVRFVGWVAVLVCALALIGPRASGAVIGNMNIANSSGFGVIVSLTTLDFVPAGSATSFMDTGAGTNVVFAGSGPLLPGFLGSVKDVNLAALPVNGFLGVFSEPLLSFDLTAIGPGVTNITALNVFDPNTAPVSPATGSPYILQSTATGTTLSFSVSGIANDASSPPSAWSGLFTTQLAGVTPFQVQQSLLSAGSFTSTWSASIVATGFIPEPGTAVLLLMGLAPLLRSRRIR